MFLLLFTRLGDLRGQVGLSHGGQVRLGHFPVFRNDVQIEPRNPLNFRIRRVVPADKERATALVHTFSLDIEDVVVGISACAIYADYAIQKNSAVNDDVHVVGPNFTPPPSRREDGFLEYKNLILHFDLFYPPELRVTEYDDGTAASTITFEAPSGNRAFQIFAVPYGESTITKVGPTQTPPDHRIP